MAPQRHSRMAQYHAVPGNYARLRQFRDLVARLWLQSIRRRSHKARHRWNWSRFSLHTRRWFPPTRILHPYPEQRLRRHHLRQEPYELMLTYGSVRGVARKGHSYRDPSWRAGFAGVCWRGAALDGDKPRRGGRVFAGVCWRGAALDGDKPRRGGRVFAGVCWRGAALDGDKPRRGGRVFAGVCWRGAALDGDKPRRGGRVFAGVCWRGAALDGDKPRRGGRVFAGLVGRPCGVFRKRWLHYPGLRLFASLTLHPGLIWGRPVRDCSSSLRALRTAL